MSAVICQTNFPCVSLADISSDESLFEFTFQTNSVGHIRPHVTLSVNSDISKLLIARDLIVAVYCLGTKALLKSITIGAAVENLRVNNSGTRFLACEDDGEWSMWTLWDVETESALESFECGLPPMFSCDDSFIVTLDPDYSTMRVLDGSGVSLNKVVTCPTSIGYFSVHPLMYDMVVYGHESGWVVWDLMDPSQIVERSPPNNSFLNWMKFGSADDVIYASISRKGSMGMLLLAYCMRTGEELFVVVPPVLYWSFDYNPSDDTLILTATSFDPHFVSYKASSGELVREKKCENCVANAFMRSNVSILM